MAEKNDLIRYGKRREAEVKRSLEEDQAVVWNLLFRESREEKQEKNYFLKIKPGMKKKRI